MSNTNPLPLPNKGVPSFFLQHLLTAAVASPTTPSPSEQSVLQPTSLYLGQETPACGEREAASLLLS